MYSKELRALKAAIEPRMMNALEKNNCIIAGGCITSVCVNSPINDIDIYFRSKESYLKFAEYIFSSMYCKMIYLTEKAMTFVSSRGDMRFQAVVCDFYEKAEDVFSDFDFTICMGAYDFETKEFVFHPRFWKDNAAREVHICGDTKYPLSSISRMLKYQSRGYTVPTSTVMKCCLMVAAMDITSWEDVRKIVSNTYGEVLSVNSDEEFSIQKAIDAIGNIESDSVTSDAGMAYRTLSAKEMMFFATTIVEDKKIAYCPTTPSFRLQDNQCFVIVDDKAMCIDKEFLWLFSVEKRDTPMQLAYYTLVKKEDSVFPINRNCPYDASSDGNGVMIYGRNGGGISCSTLEDIKEDRGYSAGNTVLTPVLVSTHNIVYIDNDRIFAKEAYAYEEKGVV